MNKKIKKKSGIDGFKIGQKSTYEIGTETDRAFLATNRGDHLKSVNGKDALERYRDKKNKTPISSLDEQAIRIECLNNIVDACDNYSIKWLSDWTHYTMNDIKLCITKSDLMPLYCLSEISRACEEVIECDPNRTKDIDLETS